MSKGYLQIVAGLFTVLFWGIFAFFFLSVMPIFGFARDAVIVFSRPVAQSYAQHVSGNVLLIMNHAVQDDQRNALIAKRSVKRIGTTDALRVTTYDRVAQRAMREHFTVFTDAQRALETVYPATMGITIRQIGTPYRVIRWPLIVGLGVGALALALFCTWVMMLFLTQRLVRVSSQQQPFFTTKNSRQKEIGVSKKPAPFFTKTAYTPAYTWSDVRDDLHDDFAKAHRTQKHEQTPVSSQEQNPQEKEELTLQEDDVLTTENEGDRNQEDAPVRPHLPEIEQTQRTIKTTEQPTKTKHHTVANTTHQNVPGNLPTVSLEEHAIKVQETTNDAQETPAKSVGSNEKNGDDDLADIGDPIEPTDEELKERLNQLLQGKL